MTALAHPGPVFEPRSPALPPIEEHVAALGFHSVLAYRLWCHRSGFDSGLEKDGEQRRLEREAARHRPQAPHLTEKRLQMHRRLAAGDANKEAIKGGLWSAYEAYKLLEGDDDAREALLKLFIHVDHYTDALSTKRIFPQESNKSMAWGLSQLARYHQRWLRPLEDWRPDAANRGRMYRTLARHLLARYEVPLFMDTAWFESDPELAQQQQEWFIVVGQGGNIRRADTPIRLTKRMAHLFLQASKGNALMRNLRWAQVVGMGGDEALAQAVLRTRLGRKFDNDEFWSSVVLFLVNNAMMDPSWAGPVVDYVYQMKFAPRRVVREEGGVDEAPPPQPDFTMKGRSATKLLRQVEAWHGDLNRQHYVQFQTWQPSGVRPFELEDETEEIGKVRWTVQELLSSWELAAEGTAMSHCAVSYSDQCADGQTSIWSICAQREGVEDRENVMTVAVDVAERTVTQARGRYNALPNQKPRTAKIRREARTGYLELLNRSNHVLRQWIDRERLRRQS